MEKIWFIYIHERTEGPFSYYDLRGNPNVTPDTFVWRQGFETWKRARDVPELQSLFEDSPQDRPKPIEEGNKRPLPREELTLELREPPYFWWFIIAVLVLLYVAFKFNNL